ncbi:MAG: 30S ribosomal protein S1 [Chlorobi bacterium]|nr:30S ribosomal protein S1 [Chlorobiota bacterium]
MPEEQPEGEAKQPETGAEAGQTAENRPSGPQTSSEPDEDFDWEAYEEGMDNLDAGQLKEFEELIEQQLKVYEENEVIEGTVTKITDKDVIIDINSKSEGVISRNEFRYNPDLKPGDKVEVMVVKKEDKNGQLVLSHRKARLLNAWEKVNEVHEKGEIVKGYIKSRTKGGMIVDIFGIESFLPGSQIDVKPITDYDQYVGQTMDFKVVKINPEFKNVVVSHKAIIEEEQEKQKREIIKQLEKGQVLEGTVKNVTSYGVFVDLGGADGLIHITDLSWSRINHPSEVVNVGDKVKVVVLDFDEKKSRIQLGMKQLEPHPWEVLDPDLKAGDKVKGKVSVVADYGAFVEIAPGVEGLLHVSDMSWSTHLRSAQDFVNPGDEVEVVILDLDREKRKLSLGMKQLTEDPWKNIEAKYPVGSVHKGKVRNFTNFGAFVELEEGVDGLIYIKDLSWDRNIKHPSEILNIGDEIMVKVLDVNPQERRISLGLKQLQENPWDKYEEKYQPGKVFEGEVKEVSGKGAVILLDGEVEAFAPGRYLMKEDGKKLKKGEKALFKVKDFDKDLQKIVVSHTDTYREDEETVQETLKKINKSTKKTLGDFEELQELKKKLEQAEKEGEEGENPEGE